jgi:hypothetical protein
MAPSLSTHPTLPLFLPSLVNPRGHHPSFFFLLPCGRAMVPLHHLSPFLSTWPGHGAPAPPAPVALPGLLPSSGTTWAPLSSLPKPNKRPAHPSYRNPNEAWTRKAFQNTSRSHPPPSRASADASPATSLARTALTSPRAPPLAGSTARPLSHWP